MKIKTFTLLLLCGLAFTAKAQLYQLYDNTSYKALYFSEATKLINNTPGLLILDVRSPGEYADTSSSITLNIGHLKGAKNISIDSIEKHMKDLEPYKDKPMLVYCSHSQRSRVVSKFLGEKGFTKVYSLNGGMSLINKSTDAEFPLKQKLYTTGTHYKLIESADAYRFIQNKNNLVVDVRPASQFNGTDSTEANNIGRIKGAINVPLAGIDVEIKKLSANKAKPILFCALNGTESVQAAQKFTAAGFKNVSVLFEGLSTFIQNTPSANQKLYFTAQPKYKIVGPKEAIALINKTPSLITADMRLQTEFENKAKMTFHNQGHLKNAQNFTVETLDAYLKNKPKTIPILIYGGMNMNMPGDPVIASAADVSKHLVQQGFTNVNLLYNGMYGMIWAVYNVEDCKDGRSVLTDHKGLY